MKYRIHILLIDETYLLEQESCKIGAIKLLHFIKLHKKFLSLQRYFLVCQTIQHVSHKTFEGCLVARFGQWLMLRQLIDIFFTCIEAEHNDLLYFVFEYFYDCRKHGRVDCKYGAIFVTLCKNCWNLLDELFHSFFTELPSAMENSYCALFTEKWQNCIGFTLQCRSDIYVSESFSLVRRLRAFNDPTTLVIVFIHCVEVDRFL